MRKTSMFLFLVLMSIAFGSRAQTAAPDDFFAGKWEIVIAGTPNGDAKLVTDLVRKDGKLTGELSDPTDPDKPKMPLTKVEENGDTLTLYFDTSQAGELALSLKKVDPDTLKGSVYNFEAVARRVK